jgi:hypothetical protein
MSALASNTAAKVTAEHLQRTAFSVCAAIDLASSDAQHRVGSA